MNVIKKEKMLRGGFFLFLLLLLFLYPVNAETAPSSECSIYIYMCGSNLESKFGLAGQNITELLTADIPENTNVVIETGGSSRWWSHGIAEDKLQRYIVRDKMLELVEELPDASMGDPATFTDFLKWGTENYPARRNILVLWDHGGSAADGVCFDENYRYDSLSRNELKSAFDDACLPQKFDLIAFDTCYMATLENACLVSDYAHYMTASQKIVPGAGMDYRVLAESFAENDIETLGHIICDSYMEKCRETGRDQEVQLSFYDLAKTEPLIGRIDKISDTLRTICELTGISYEVFNAAMKAHVANSSKGANVIDLCNFTDNLSHLDLFRNGKQLRKAADDLICYQVQGEKADCTGVSIYYPLRYNENQLNTYLEMAPSEGYSRLLDEIYGNLPDERITFKNPGRIAEDGSFEIVLGEKSRRYLRGIICRIWRESEVIPGQYNLLFDGEVETYDSWLGRIFLPSLKVNSTFDGTAAALNGYVLLMSVVSRIDMATYSAPVCVNGEDTWYSFVRSKRNGVHSLVSTTLGSGSDENGLPTRDIRQLMPGDRVSVYAAIDEEGKELVPQEEFIIGEEGPVLAKVPLPVGRYRYQFIATDIIGNTVGSDYCIFEITEENGERTAGMKEVVKKE